MSKIDTLVDRIVAENIDVWGWGPLEDIEGLAEHQLAVDACRAGYHSALTALSLHNAKLVEALTASGETKAAYHGEFKFDVPLDGYDDEGEPLEGVKSVYVPWTTIKEIMAAIKRQALKEGVQP